VIQRTTRDYDRKHRRNFRVAFVASILFHVLVLLAFRTNWILPPSPFAAAGPKSGDDRAAAGGGTKVIALQIVQPQPQPEQVKPAVPVPVPVPEPEIEEIVDDPKPQVAQAVEAPVAAVATAGEGRGANTGQGLEAGTGRGDGGTDEAGLFRVIPPSPRGLILPPSDRPKQVRGREIDVWVYVTHAGKVVADSTRIAPSSGDRKFDDRLKKQAADWVFEPARRGGRAVAEWFRYTLIL
jgi:outer membrane biosynthesis protein TonB